MNERESFGQRLRRLRQERGLSQRQMAGDGVSASYVSLLESGRRAPTAAVIARLAERLGGDPKLLAEGTPAADAAQFELALRYAELALHSGEAVDAAEQFRLLADRDAPTPDRVRTDARWGRARALEAAGNLEAAIVAYESLREAAEARPHDLPWLPCVIALCRCYREVGDLAHSIDLGESARSQVERLGLVGTDLAVELASTLVGSYHERGDLIRARVLADQVIEAAERLDSSRARGAAYWNASLVADELGRTAEGLQLAERALALYAHGEDARSLARLRTAYAGLLLRQAPPRPREARPLLEAAAAQLADTGSEVDRAYVDTELGRAALLSGSADEAVTMARRALERLGDGPRLEAAQARLVLGHAEFSRGNEDAALASYARAGRDLADMGASRQAAAAWRELAEMFQGLGRADEALDAYRRSSDAVGIPAPTAVMPPRRSAARRRQSVPAPA